TVISAFSNPKPSSFDQLCKNHLITSIDILHFIKNNQKPMPPAPQKRRLPLPTKPSLIFDLDETLIHCNENANMPCDILLPIKFPNGATVKAGINIRPYVK
ncbi:MAG: NIF family HAD-type phosphatase, partial [Flammeovirgaceae bacterium]